MTSFPDPDNDGGYAFRAQNRYGQTAKFGIDGQPPNRTYIEVPTAQGFDIRLPNGQTIGVVETDGRTTFVQVPQLQLVIPPAPPAPYIVDADTGKNVIAAIAVAPIQINLPSVMSGTGAVYYILALDPITPTPVGAPLPFPVQINTFGGNAEPVNLGPGPKFLTTCFQLGFFLGPGSGGWGAFTMPLLP